MIGLLKCKFEIFDFWPSNRYNDPNNEKGE